MGLASACDVYILEKVSVFGVDDVFRAFVGFLVALNEFDCCLHFNAIYCSKLVRNLRSANIVFSPALKKPEVTEEISQLFPIYSQFECERLKFAAFTQSGKFARKQLPQAA